MALFGAMHDAAKFDPLYQQFQDLNAAAMARISCALTWCLVNAAAHDDSMHGQMLRKVVIITS